MTWSEFCASVYGLLPADATRKNIGVASSGEPYATRIIRLAVIDLQRFIAPYRSGQQTLYTPSDLTIQGKTSVGTVPEGKIRQMFYVKTSKPNCCRRPVVTYAGGWENRSDLVCGNVTIVNGQFLGVIDPFAETFQVFPVVEDGYEIEVIWDGIKRTFEDDDSVKFNEETANAVSLYVRAYIEREVNRNEAGFLGYMGVEGRAQPGTYIYERQQLYVNEIGRTSMDSQKDSPSNNTCGTCSCEDEEEYE